MLSPNGWSIATPPELGPYGWTTMDLWVAPLATAIYAYAAQLQPFFVSLNSLIGSAEGAKPMSTDDARSATFVVLATLFTAKAMRNFGGDALKNARKAPHTVSPQARQIKANMKNGEIDAM